MRLTAGSPARLGASWDGRGTNFALFSANAQKIELCLFDSQGRRELERIELPERTEDVWHGYLNDISPGQLYGYRVRVPSAGKWKEVFNSDSGHYGGSNVGNIGEVHAVDGRTPELSLTIPPLAAIFLVPES